MASDDLVKIAQEHLARAKAYINKNRPADSLLEAIAGVKLSLDRRVVGRQKIMLNTYLNDFLQALSKNSDVKQQFQQRKIFSMDHFVIRTGQEREALQVLRSLHAWMGGAEQNKADLELKLKQETVKELYARGMRLLEEGDDLKARVCLRKVAIKKAADKEIPCKIAEAFLERKMLHEAADVCLKAMEANPANGKAYSLAVEAYLQAGDFPRAEEVYKQALKRFGAHPRTYLNMAKMYWEWRKWSECYEAAQQAASGEVEIRSEAEKILEKVSSRIFAGR
ncbi:MAG: hypothetical protein PWQ57_2553 [Desulfovibrionales bacterium]|jgi:tetratricopeptide (TPR) repeat protein|nr:hypothetical protein [Desulfovibrionales bacterium]